MSVKPIRGTGSEFSVYVVDVLDGQAPADPSAHVVVAGVQSRVMQPAQADQISGYVVAALRPAAELPPAWRRTRLQERIAACPRCGGRDLPDGKRHSEFFDDEGEAA